LSARNGSDSGEARVRRLFAALSLVLVIIVTAAWAAVGSASAATPKVCAELKVTTALVKQVFGRYGSIPTKDVSQVGRCALQAGVHGKPPTNCDEPSTTCLPTDLEVRPASDLEASVTDSLSTLSQYGHAHKMVIPGTGSTGVLLTASSYAGVTNPSVWFKAGAYAVVIEGPFGGATQRRAVLSDWEKLARQIYKRLG
jgi:hypothetical protein